MKSSKVFHNLTHFHFILSLSLDVFYVIEHQLNNEYLNDRRISVDGNVDKSEVFCSGMTKQQLNEKWNTRLKSLIAYSVAVQILVSFREMNLRSTVIKRTSANLKSVNKNQAEN